MTRTASPGVVRSGYREPYTQFESSYMHDDRYTLWYERTVMHWTEHQLDWFYQEQLVLQEKATGQYFWLHEGQMIPVVSLKEVMSKYFFEVLGEYKDEQEKDNDKAV